MRQTPITRAAGRRADKRRHKRKNRFLRQSKRFIERDKPVFPVKPNSKIPLTCNGFKDATTDLSQLEEWAEKFPDANIGIPTGDVSGFVVIDLDCKNGVDGVKKFECLCSELRVDLPETYRVKTPSGGEHIYFQSKHAGQIRNSAGVIAPGVDVRGEGGYVVAPGSVVDGKKYEVIEGRLESVARLPKKLRRKLQQAKRPKQRIAGSNGHSYYHKGQRNDALFRDACGLRAAGKPHEKVLELARCLNDSNCVPPLDDGEVVSIVDSALSYENTPSANDAPETALTDMGNARRFAIANEGKLKYIHELGKYIVREEGQHWRHDEGAEYVLVKKSALGLLEEVPNIDDLEIQKSVSKHGIRSESKTSIEACLKLAQTEPEISASIRQFDNKPGLLPVKNGVMDLHTGIYRPTTGDDYFLKTSPVAYDADAECPNWFGFLKLVQPARSMRRYLQKLAGLTLLGSATQEIIIFLYGGAGTGKSTFVKTIMKVLGHELAIKFPTSVLLARRWDGPANELLPFFGARMAVATEVPENRRFNEAMVKDLASNDMLTTRPLYREAIQFAPTHTLWLYGNHLPRVDGADPGIERRLCLLPFKRVIPESMMDKNFDEKLEPELAGILNWLIDGCLASQRTGVRQPQRVSQATKGYLSDNDLIKLFIKERIIDRVGKKESATAVYTAYKAWAQDRGEWPLSMTKFGTALVERGLRKKKFEKGNFYLDIKVLRHGDQ